jgi:hypothetical protein
MYLLLKAGLITVVEELKFGGDKPTSELSGNQEYEFDM